MQVNMLDAKNQLSKLVKAAVDGENVVIAFWSLMVTC